MRRVAVRDDADSVEGVVGIGYAMMFGFSELSSVWGFVFIVTRIACFTVFAAHKLKDKQPVFNT
jgi:hypothetical protein